MQKKEERNLDFKLFKQFWMDLKNKEKDKGIAVGIVVNLAIKWMFSMYANVLYNIIVNVLNIYRKMYWLEKRTYT